MGIALAKIIKYLSMKTY